MVGGLVQDEDIRLGNCQAGEDESCRLTTGQITQALFDIVAGEQDPGQISTNEADRLIRTEPPDPCFGRVVV